MFKWLSRFFRRKTTVQPAFPALIEAWRRMQAKDPDLANSLRDLSVSDARSKWREKYPDDLTSDLVSQAVIH